MKGSRATALLVVLAGVASSGPSALAATQCLRLTNATAPIYSAVSLIATDKKSDLANLPLYKLLAPLDRELPWLSTCLASADILSLGVGLLSDPVAAKCIGSIMPSGNASSSNSTSASPSLLSGGGDFATTLCPSLNTTLFPCVNNVLVGAIEKLMTSGGACCTDMQQKLPALLGQDLKTFMAALMVRIGDVICSVKTYVDVADGQSKNETCGQSIVSSLLNGEDLADIIQLVQIPNDQGCAAMKGQNFTATNGKSYRFFGRQTPIDSCFAPMNLLFTDLGKLPMIAQSNISTMFDAGRCLQGNSIISMALNETGLIQGMAVALDGIVADMKLMPAGAVTKIVRSGFDDMTTDFGPMCFHLANSVNDCVYNSTVAYAFSKDAPPPSVAKGDGGGSPSSGKSSAVHHNAASVLVTALVMLSSIGVVLSPTSWV